jgi:hypothetical protein
MAGAATMMLVGCAARSTTDAPARLVRGGQAAPVGGRYAAATSVSNPDTKTLQDMAATKSGSSVASVVRLRDGSITVAPDGSLRALSVAAARSTMVSDGLATNPDGCWSGLLTDSDIFSLAADGAHQLTYVAQPVWMCVQLGVPGTSMAAGDLISTNVVTFVDSATGKLLFTVQDQA